MKAAKLFLACLLLVLVSSPVSLASTGHTDPNDVAHRLDLRRAESSTYVGDWQGISGVRLVFLGSWFYEHVPWSRSPVSRFYVDSRGGPGADYWVVADWHKFIGEDHATLHCWLQRPGALGDTVMDDLPAYRRASAMGCTFPRSLLNAQKPVRWKVRAILWGGNCPWLCQDLAPNTGWFRGL